MNTSRNLGYETIESFNNLKAGNEAYYIQRSGSGLAQALWPVKIVSVYMRKGELHEARVSIQFKGDKYPPFIYPDREKIASVPSNDMRTLEQVKEIEHLKWLPIVQSAGSRMRKTHRKSMRRRANTKRRRRVR